MIEKLSPREASVAENAESQVKLKDELYGRRIARKKPPRSSQGSGSMLDQQVGVPNNHYGDCFKQGGLWQ